MSQNEHLNDLTSLEALKIANQRKANLQLCNVAARPVRKKLIIHDYDDILLDEYDDVDMEGLAQQLNITEQTERHFLNLVPVRERVS